MRKYWHILVVLVLLTSPSGCSMVFDAIRDLFDDDDDCFSAVEPDA